MGSLSFSDRITLHGKNSIGRVIFDMEMETVKLSRIVRRLAPDLIPFLKKQELESTIILRDGLEILERQDAVEIVQHSIYRDQKDHYLH